VALLAAGVFVAAAIAAVLGLWLPARQRTQDAAWTAAGERALARVALPATFSTDTKDGRNQVCGTGTSERCFLGPGDPRDQVAAVKAGLAHVATGPIEGTCAAVPVAGAPPSCHLVVPVTGSRLAVEMFAHLNDPGQPMSQWTYDGAYVEIHLTAR